MSNRKPMVKARSKRQVPAVLLGLLLTVGAGVGVALWSSAQSERSPVLVAATDLNVGDVVERSDLRVAWVAVDDSVQTLPESASASLAGSTVVAGITEGSLVAPGMFGGDESLVPAGMTVVGATLDTGRYPSLGLRPGDRVILVHTTSNGPVRIGEAEVFAVTRLVDSLAGDLFVSLLLPPGDAVDATAGAAASEDLSVVAIGGS